jgi:hypothetical protein
MREAGCSDISTLLVLSLDSDMVVDRAGPDGQSERLRRPTPC